MNITTVLEPRAWTARRWWTFAILILLAHVILVVVFGAKKLKPVHLVTNVPVYGVEGDRQVYLGRVFAEGADTRFTLAAPADVKQLALDPYHTVLTQP